MTWCGVTGGEVEAEQCWWGEPCGSEERVRRFPVSFRAIKVKR